MSLDRLEKRTKFLLYLIKPSHYDDDGYIIQWARSEVPSNTLAALNGIVEDCIERQVLGYNVDIEIIVQDEYNTRTKPKKIIRDIRACGGKALVALVGVQSNQFPRAIDIARPLRAANVPVCIGGFHVSGCLAMLPEVPPDIQEAMDLGVSIFAGEAEGRLEGVLKDAYRNKLEPLYNFLSDLPGLEGSPIPILPAGTIQRHMSARTSFDCGRGCPFQCSFCTIINVQGRKSRFRSADDVEQIVRRNWAQGITGYFITDDNFARNKNWEEILDRLIELRDEGIRVSLILQVDTLCHLIPNFIEKAGRAGCDRVFIGLENINPDNLTASKKKQNRISEYRVMLQAWMKIGASVWCGYIIGFPNDTPERVIRDIEIVKRELPVDFLEFFCLTPLPGSEDHKVLHEKGVWMDPDMNKYDAEHVCTGHPIMSAEEFQNLYSQAWAAYYSPDHIETLMRRAVISGTKSIFILKVALFFYGSQSIEGVHPLQGGYFRRKYRHGRRPELPVESPFKFYPSYLWSIASKYARALALAWSYWRIRARVERDPSKHDYMDVALTPAVDEDLDVLDIFSATESANIETAKVRERRAKRATAKTAA